MFYKWAVRVFLLCLLLCSIAYLSFPVWANSLVTYFLPKEVSLVKASWNFPGVSSIKANDIVLRITTDSMIVEASLESLTLDGHRRELELKKLQADVQSVKSNSPSKPPALPSLDFMQQLPQWSINADAIDVNYSGSLPSKLQLAELKLETAQNRLMLSTDWKVEQEQGKLILDAATTKSHLQVSQRDEIVAEVQVTHSSTSSWLAEYRLTLDSLPWQRFAPPALSIGSMKGNLNGKLNINQQFDVSSNHELKALNLKEVRWRGDFDVQLEALTLSSTFGIQRQGADWTVTGLEDAVVKALGGRSLLPQQDIHFQFETLTVANTQPLQLIVNRFQQDNWPDYAVKAEVEQGSVKRGPQQAQFQQWNGIFSNLDACSKCVVFEQSLRQLEHPQAVVDTLTAKGRYQLSESLLEADIVALNAQRRAGMGELQPVNFNGNLRSNTQRLDVDGMLTSALFEPAPIQFWYVFESQKSLLTLPKMESKIDALRPVVAPFLADFDALNIISGNIFSKLDYQLQNQNAKGEVKANSFAMSYEQLGAEGIELDATFSMQQENLKASGHGKVASLSLPMESNLSDTSFDFNLLSKDSGSVKNFSSHWFDSHISFAEMKFDSPQSIQRTLVQIKRMDLIHLFNMINVEGLSGRGLIDLEIPVGVEQGKGYVADGVFEAQGKGAIAYVNPAAKALGQQNIAFQALENFEYEHFSGTINYSTEGDYVIEIKLVGRNPQVMDGYPISFNLNINGQLPALFKSVFLTGDMSENIMEQIKHSSNSQN
ncbi:YdbH domain-containing protein [Pleionea sp. CnH1-48]|uniref:intermembrane phospholipid transport protein YdbH family protein n=1 Tax=Pleionea sp. CnH1-48 TaxID=2954494 RepID=UPI002096C4C7|nr:YdbH domain-containing protein [Pleionea sp. CnH1-48]MCO7224665.1 YdbH domain-containing protein [Pleionea sp. CnH1-48]